MAQDLVHLGTDETWSMAQWLQFLSFELRSTMQLWESQRRNLRIHCNHCIRDHKSLQWNTCQANNKMTSAYLHRALVWRPAQNIPEHSVEMMRSRGQCQPASWCKPVWCLVSHIGRSVNTWSEIFTTLWLTCYYFQNVLIFAQYWIFFTIVMMVTVNDDCNNDDGH